MARNNESKTENRKSKDRCESAGRMTSAEPRAFDFRLSMFRLSPASARWLNSIVLAGMCLAGSADSSTLAQSAFVNWETPHVSPITLTPSGNTLLAVNTPDVRG